MGHKSRNDFLDNLIPEKFESAGFFGSQVDEKDMDDVYKDKRIDIFKLEFDHNNENK